MTFIGRTKEQEKLLAQLSSPTQNAALLYGRRRVGKSELILHTMRQASGIRSIYYECRQTTAENNTRNLSEVIAEAFDMPPLAFSDIEAALRFVFDRALSEKIALAIDEYPYLRDVVKGMDSILQVLLDEYRDRSHLSLILCGSYVEVMKSLLERDNPLYGRIDLKINLQPMDYYESAQFYPERSCEDKVRLFSVFGGIPYYNRLIDKNASVRENLIHLILEPDARLEDEVPSYLLSEISKIGNAHETFSALVDGHARYRDILAQSHVSSGATLVNVLNRLIGMQLVQRRSPINDPNNKKRTSYVISDGLSKFYYRYVFRYLSQRSVLDPEVFYDRYVNDDFETQFVPRAFEEVCRQYLVRQNRLGNSEPPFDLIGTYSYDDPVTRTNGEFDVVTKDPLGYSFYEAKFRTTPITQRMIEDEIEQVQRTGLTCHRYGFFSRSGFEAQADERTALIGLEELYR
ncbi:ATP-binding protein [Enorma shizhengliae]|uniref:ATP-binding protein n=1 Tax=Enorma shizhengliae TaxID=2606615 RepID=A0A7K0G9U4_9ACTN|nr:ATP-binding protein [Enorma shizhengliae]MRX80585.1 ATP-binding protein [Enorma shizhengliae]